MSSIASVTVPNETLSNSSTRSLTAGRRSRTPSMTGSYSMNVVPSTRSSEGTSSRTSSWQKPFSGEAGATSEFANSSNDTLRSDSASNGSSSSSSRRQPRVSPALGAGSDASSFSFQCDDDVHSGIQSILGSKWVGRAKHWIPGLKGVTVNTHQDENGRTKYSVSVDADTKSRLTSFAQSDAGQDAISAFDGHLGQKAGQSVSGLLDKFKAGTFNRTDLSNVVSAAGSFVRSGRGRNAISAFFAHMNKDASSSDEVSSSDGRLTRLSELAPQVAAR